MTPARRLPEAACMAAMLCALAFGACESESSSTGAGAAPGGAAAMGGTSAVAGAGGAGLGTSTTSSSSTSSTTVTSPPKEDGLSCASSEQCASGYCPADDSVCCDTPCDGPCEACLEDKTDRPNGECAPIPADTDPDSECVEPGACSAAGRCCNERPVAVAPAECPAECTGGCTDSECLIACDANGACEDMTITCPAGLACTVACVASSACRDATIQCPATYPCRLQCESDLTSSCRRAAVLCATGTCEVTCEGWTACQDVTVQCGPEVCAATCPGMLDAEPSLSCNDSCACQPCD